MGQVLIDRELVLAEERLVLTLQRRMVSHIKGRIKKLEVFENAILRRIFGPIYNVVNEQWERRHNTDLRQLSGQPFIQDVCEGLDTVAEVSINGIHVGNASNMFVRWKVFFWKRE